MCVQVTSWGVDSWQLTDVWLNRSSGVNWSGMSLRAESGSKETKHALRMLGKLPACIKLHWPQISLRCFEAFTRALRLSRPLQPAQRNNKKPLISWPAIITRRQLFNTEDTYLSVHHDQYVQFDQQQDAMASHFETLLPA